MTTFRRWMALSASFLVFGIVNACAPLPAEGEMPFELVEQAEYSPYYTALEPGLIVVDSPEALDTFGLWFSAAARERLHKMNGQLYVGVGVFQGWQRTGGYAVTIERIEREGDIVRVHARLTEPAPGVSLSGWVTSPYQLALARKIGPWHAQIAYELVSGTQILARWPTPEP